MGLSTVIFLLSTSVQAQSALTWQECVERASRDNPAIKAALASLESQKDTTRSQIGNFLPQVSGNVGWSYGTSSGSQNVVGSSFASPSDLNNSPSARSSTSSYSASITATQNIFNGMADYAKVEQGKSNEAIARANLETVKAQVSYDLKSAFEGLVYAQQYVTLSSDIINRRKENLDMVQLRYENGEENKGSLLLSKANLDQANFDKLQGEDSINVARAQLARVLGMDDYEGLEVAGTVPIQAPPEHPDFKQLAGNTPEHQQAVSQLSLQEANVTAARSGFLPTLNFTTTAGKQGPWFPNSDRWSLGLSLAIPIFSGGKDYYATRSALQAKSSASFTLENTDRNLLEALKQAYTTYFEAIEKLKVDQSFREAAIVRADIARASYNNGLISFQDWDQIEDDLITRQKNELQSERDRVVNEAAWEKQLGQGVIP